MRMARTGRRPRDILRSSELCFLRRRNARWPLLTEVNPADDQIARCRTELEDEWGINN
jgi:hypothetical protein